VAQRKTKKVQQKASKRGEKVNENEEK